MSGETESYPDFDKNYHKGEGGEMKYLDGISKVENSIRTIIQAIKALQAMEESGEELPKKINYSKRKEGSEAGEPTQWDIAWKEGANYMIDQLQPFIAKKNMRIKELEEKLQQSEARYRGALQSIKEWIEKKAQALQQHIRGGLKEEI